MDLKIPKKQVMLEKKLHALEKKLREVNAAMEDQLGVLAELVKNDPDVFKKAPRLERYAIGVGDRYMVAGAWFAGTMEEADKPKLAIERAIAWFAGIPPVPPNAAEAADALPNAAGGEGKTADSDAESGKAADEASKLYFRVHRSTCQTEP